MLLQRRRPSSRGSGESTVRVLMLALSTMTTTTTIAWTGPPAPRRFPATRRMAATGEELEQPSPAKPICGFDAEDFAGPPGTWPYTAADLNRLDNSDDANFYDEPRFVTHIDDNAISVLTSYYRETFRDVLKAKNDDGAAALDVLDLCSSWISHLPSAETDDGIRYGEVVGLGMNRAELEANEQLTKVLVKDLNRDPSLAEIPDDSFDVVCNVVSVDYLTKPQEVFGEMLRVLRPGGVALVSFSNRCFATKAVAMWLQADDIGRLTIVASYFHYSSDGWKDIEAIDLRGEPQEVPERPSAGAVLANPALGLAWMNAASAVQRRNAGDPMFLVRATKKEG